MALTARRRGATDGRLAGWLALVLALTALNYWARYADGGATTDRDAFYEWSLFVGTLVQFGLMLGLTLWIAAGAPARELLAWRPPRSWATAAGGSALVFVVVFVVAAALEPVLEAGDEQGFAPEEWQPDRAAPFAANVAATALFVPVVEELLFRGAGVSLLARFGPTVAALGTGLIFGLAHGLVRALPVLVAFGIALALLRLRTASVWPCVVVHGVFNLVAVILSVSTGGGGGT